MPFPPDGLPLTLALHHASRSVALAALGKPEAARQEQSAFVHAREAVPAEWVVGNNPGVSVLQPVTHLLEGEILYREGQVERALAALNQAAGLEDALRYDEPPGWLLPIRHALGATLMKEGRFAEAESVYRDDLKRRPENGWSLFGLAESLSKLGKKTEADAMLERFGRVWSKADVRIRSSCYCQPGLAERE